LEIKLDEKFFSKVCWAKAVNRIMIRPEKRNFLGLHAVESDVLWRYFLKIQEYEIKMTQIIEEKSN